MPLLLRPGVVARRRWPGFLALLVVIGVSSVHAQTPAPPDDAVVAKLTGQLTDFFSSVSSGEANAAFETLLADSQLAKRDRQEQLSALVKKTTDLPAAYGAFRSVERIVAKRIGADLVVFKYLYKCENFPVVWHVVFYRDLRELRPIEAANSWRVISIRFDTDLEALSR